MGGRRVRRYIGSDMSVSIFNIISCLRRSNSLFYVGDQNQTRWIKMGKTEGFIRADIAFLRRKCTVIDRFDVVPSPNTERPIFRPCVVSR